MSNSVWIFAGIGGHHAAGVFRDEERARQWIEKHRLNGVLTRYPLDTGLFDWAVEEGYLKPEPDQHAPEFIQQFSTGYLEHYHFEDGE